MGRSVLPLLNELRIIAQNGLEYADDPHDRERYERLLQLASEYYGEVGDLPASAVRSRFDERVGHVTPNVGARAAVVDDRGRILVMKRADDGRWGLPGGFSEPGETPAETEVGEAREETGLEVEPVELVTFRFRRPDERNPHGFVGAVYLCRVTGGTLEGSHQSEALRYERPDRISEWHEDDERAARDALARWTEKTS